VEYHQGRLLDHLHLTVRDHSASRRFYSAILAVLGIPIDDHPTKRAFSADELWITDEGR